ncbi:ABC transporter ATP-binding protein [Fictibacillus sp. 7GRE50]|nr:oligopeptide/dipeptide ABC transporter ATP-binding protein [Fictibacillus sp. 23RED33]MBH0166888.1 ABC transporter ATP-binding protein [Fictibacillus sp. 7GRE50]MBH0173490.1 ABC transporter ATP-binding protein [Fictibacillus sp. 23RED33]
MNNDVLIQVKNLSKVFTKKAGMFNRKSTRILAVNDVNLSIHKGEVLGIIGESGSGKTTTARMIMKLINSSHGEIHFNGFNLDELKPKQMRKLRSQMQMVFQDPYETLNPSMRIVDILAEPITAHEPHLGKKEQLQRIKETVESIELVPAEDYIYRYPHELSGGQRQRIAIARAIILKPQFIAADEPTSMLDVSVRAGILNVLKTLKKKMGLTMIYITHDLATASYMCDRIAVMYQGEIVEIGPTDKIIRNPSHPYTKALVSVVSNLLHFIENRSDFIYDGEVKPSEVTEGCVFVNRCPYRIEKCFKNTPSLKAKEEQHHVSCHLSVTDDE